MASRGSDSGDDTIPGKIFVGGLPRYITEDAFVQYFGKYGEITHSVILKDPETGRPRGFGFITYADPFIVDTVIAETHIINGKQVEIQRPIPEGSGGSNVFETRKIFVGGIPTYVTEDELRDFFSKYGNVVEHKIIQNHSTKKSRGFGFVTFDTKQVADSLLAGGNMIDMEGTLVEIKRAKRKIPSNPTSTSSYRSMGSGLGDRFSNCRGRTNGPLNSSYNIYGSDDYSPSYRSMGPGLGDRSEIGGGREFGYRGDSPLDYSSQFGPYNGSVGRESSSGQGSYDRGGYGSYEGASYDAGGVGGSGRGAGGLYGGRTGGYNGRIGTEFSSGQGSTSYGRGGYRGASYDDGGVGGSGRGARAEGSYSGRTGGYNGRVGRDFSSGQGSTSYGRGGYRGDSYDAGGVGGSGRGAGGLYGGRTGGYSGSSNYHPFFK